MGEIPTKVRILDAAEALFAHRGFDGVTVRQIMSRANADVALAYYHFKSKRGLFDAVMTRRVDTLNEVRMRALEDVERRHEDDAPTVEESCPRPGKRTCTGAITSCPVP